MLPMEQELCKGYEMCKGIQDVQRNKNVLISQNAVHKGPKWEQYLIFCGTN